MSVFIDHWVKRGLWQAKVQSAQSKDPSTQCGAVIMRPDNTYAGFGFNGLAPGVDDSHINDRDFKIACVLHAEENAILKSRDYDMYQYKLFVWGLACCSHCTAMAITRGVDQILSVQTKFREEWRYSQEVARRIAEEANIEYNVLNLNDVAKIDKKLLMEVPVFINDPYVETEYEPEHD